MSASDKIPSMPNTSPLPSTPGYHDLIVDVDGVPIAVTLHLPATPRAAPLVMALHYGGPPVGYYGRGLLEQLIVPAWQTLNAVFVAPVSQGGEWQSPANSRAVRGLLQQIEAHYATAERARYLVGYSLGAIGCWYFLQQTDLAFAAAVPIAGQIPDSLVTFTTPTHVLHSNGDRLFPSETLQPRLETLRANQCPLAFKVLEGIDHFNVSGYLPALRELLAWLPACPPRN